MWGLKLIHLGVGGTFRKIIQNYKHKMRHRALEQVRGLEVEAASSFEVNRPPSFGLRAREFCGPSHQSIQVGGGSKRLEIQCLLFWLDVC